MASLDKVLPIEKRLCLFYIKLQKLFCVPKKNRLRARSVEVPLLHHIKPIRPRLGLIPECLQRLASCLINTWIVKQSQKWYQYKKEYDPFL